MNTFEWYQRLQKPWFAPASNVFGIAWGILYPIIFASFGYVFYLYTQRKIPFYVLLPFILNLFFNLIFSPIQFGLQNNFLAALDITLVVITLIWGMYSIYSYSKVIALVQIPYLLWGIFATILQFSITYLNR
jgi:tryptophan-rich sensory protein